MKLILGIGIAAAAIAFPYVAQSADIPVKAPIYKPAPVPYVVAYNWSGYYIGSHIGGARSQQKWAGLDDGGAVTILDTGYPPSFTLSRSAFAYGAHAGAQWQFNRFVLGGEVTGTWADMQAVARGISTTPGTDDNLISTVHAWFTGVLKVGYATDRTLLYLKGGYAGANLRTAIYDQLVPIFGTWSVTKWHGGWTAGVGIEYALNSNWIFGIEGNYVRLSSLQHSALDANGAGPIFTNASVNIASALARVSYKVDWDGALVTKY
jgi:outer membrane immunogenic protein